MTNNTSETKVEPKVFISYSWTSEEYTDEVLEIAKRLRSDGVDAIIDRWDLKEGHDKYAFMEQSVTNPEVLKVLCFCDRGYREKADARAGGVGTEAQVITPHLYEQTQQEKFIPVIMEKDDENKPYAPAFLNGLMYIDFTNEEYFEKEYERLLRCIFERPLHRKPPLGSAPAYLFEEERSTLHTTSKFRRFRHAIENGKDYAKGAATEYVRSFIKALEELIIKEGAYPEIQIDDQIINKIDFFEPYREEFFEFLQVIIDYSNNDIYYKITREMFQNALSLDAVEDKSREWFNWKYEALRFVLRDLFLTQFTLLIKNEKYDEADFFLKRDFIFIENYQENLVSYVIFDTNFPTLDERRNKRLKLGRLSVAVDEIKQRSNLSEINFRFFMQSDMILALRHILHNNDSFGFFRWFPRTLLYTSRMPSPFPLFNLAVKEEQFEILKKLLKIKSKKDLLQKFEHACSNHGLGTWRWQHKVIDWRALMNLDNIPDEF